MIPNVYIGENILAKELNGMTLSRRQWLLALLAVPLLFVGAFIVSQWQLPVQAQDNSAEASKRTVTVNGTGQITIEPDVAYVNLGVLTNGKTADEAQQENAAIFEKLNDVLFQQFKIDEKDVKTVSFNLRPDYSYQEGKEPTITGYTASHMIRITYRDLDRIGELLDAAVKAGVNQINRVEYATEKFEEYELQAMELAMKNARQKAERLAATEGQTIKGVVQISQHGTNYGIYAAAAASVAFDAVPKSTTTVNPGEIEISAAVTVVYEF